MDIATPLDDEIGVYTLGASLWCFIAAFFGLLGYYIVANDPSDIAAGEKASKARTNYHQLYVACNDCELTDGAAKVVSRSLERSFTPYRLSLQKHCFAEQGLSLLSDGLRTAATRDPRRKINAFDLRGVEVSWQSMSQLLVTCNQPTKIQWSEALKRFFGTQITLRISACALAGTACVVIASVLDVKDDTKTMLLIIGGVSIAIPTAIVLGRLVLLIMKRCAVDRQGKKDTAEYKAQQALERAAGNRAGAGLQHSTAWRADRHPAWGGMSVRLRLKTANSGMVMERDSKWIGSNTVESKEEHKTLENMEYDSKQWATPRKRASQTDDAPGIEQLSPIPLLDSPVPSTPAAGQAALPEVTGAAGGTRPVTPDTPATPSKPPLGASSFNLVSPGAKPADVIELCQTAKESAALVFDLEADSIETGTRFYQYKPSTIHDGVKHWIKGTSKMGNVTLTDVENDAACFLFEQLLDSEGGGFRLQLQPMKTTKKEADEEAAAGTPRAGDEVWEANGTPFPLFDESEKRLAFEVCIDVDTEAKQVQFAEEKAGAQLQERVAQDGLTYRLIWQQEAGKSAGGGTLTDEFENIKKLAKRSVSIHIRIADQSDTRAVSLKRGQVWPLTQLEGGKTFDTHPDKTGGVTKELVQQTWEGPSTQLMWNYADDPESSSSEKVRDMKLNAKEAVFYRPGMNTHGLELSKEKSRWGKVTAKIEVYLAQDLSTDQLVRDVLGTSFADPSTIEKVLADSKYIDACRKDLLGTAPDRFWNTVLKVAQSSRGGSDQIPGGAKRYFGLSERLAVRGLHGALGLARSRGVVECMQLGNNTSTPGLKVTFPMTPKSLASSSLTKRADDRKGSKRAQPQQQRQLANGGSSSGGGGDSSVTARQVFTRIPAAQMLLRIPATDDRADVMARMLQRNVLGSSFLVDPRNAAATRKLLEGFDYAKGTIAMGSAETRALVLLLPFVPNGGAMTIGDQETATAAPGQFTGKIVDLPCALARAECGQLKPIKRVALTDETIGLFGFKALFAALRTGGSGIDHHATGGLLLDFSKADKVADIGSRVLRADGALLEPLIKELERKANRKRLPPTWSIDVSNRTIAPKLLKSLLQVLKNYPLHTLTLSDCDLGHTSKLVPGSEKKLDLITQKKVYRGVYSPHSTINALKHSISSSALRSGLRSLSIAQNRNVGDKDLVQLLDVLKNVPLTSLDISATGCGLPIANKIAVMLEPPKKKTETPFSASLDSLSFDSNGLCEEFLVRVGTSDKHIKKVPLKRNRSSGGGGVYTVSALPHNLEPSWTETFKAEITKDALIVTRTDKEEGWNHKPIFRVFHSNNPCEAFFTSIERSNITVLSLQDCGLGLASWQVLLPSRPWLSINMRGAKALVSQIPGASLRCTVVNKPRSGQSLQKGRFGKVSGRWGEAAADSFGGEVEFTWLDGSRESVQVSEVSSISSPEELFVGIRIPKDLSESKISSLDFTGMGLEPAELRIVATAMATMPQLSYLSLKNCKIGIELVVSEKLASNKTTAAATAAKLDADDKKKKTHTSIKKGDYAALKHPRYGIVTEVTTGPGGTKLVKLKWLDDNKESPSLPLDRLEEVKDYSHITKFGESVSSSKLRRLDLSGCSFDETSLDIFHKAIIDYLTSKKCVLEDVRMEASDDLMEGQCKQDQGLEKDLRETCKANTFKANQESKIAEMKEKLSEATKLIVAGHSVLELTDVSFSSKTSGLSLEAFIKSWDGPEPKPDPITNVVPAKPPAKWKKQLKAVIFDRCVLTESTFKERDQNSTGFVKLCNTLYQSEVQEVRFKDCLLGPKGVEAFVVGTLNKWVQKRSEHVLKVVDLTGSIIGNGAGAKAMFASVKGLVAKEMLQSIVIGDGLELDLRPAPAAPTAATVSDSGEAVAPSDKPDPSDPEPEPETTSHRLEGSNKDIDTGGAELIAWWLQETDAGKACQHLDISKNKFEPHAANLLAAAVGKHKRLQHVVVGKYATEIPANSDGEDLILEHQDLGVEELAFAVATVDSKRLTGVVQVHMDCALNAHGTVADGERAMRPLLLGLGGDGLNVKDLDISECRLTSGIMDALAGVINKGVHKLVLNRNGIWGTLSDSFDALAPDKFATVPCLTEMFKALEASTKLTELSLANTGIGPVTAATLATKLPSTIKKLNLSGCPLTGAKCKSDGSWTTPTESEANTKGFKELCVKLGLTELEELNVSDCHLQDMSAEYIATELLKNSTSLHTIDFSRNDGVGYGGAEAIAVAIVACTQLKRIIVGKHSTEIAVHDTDKQYTKLPDLEKLEAVVGFGPAEIRLIAAAAATRPALREVDLSKTTIGKAGASTVLALEQLRQKSLHTVTLGKGKMIPLKQKYGPTFLWDEDDDDDVEETTTGGGTAALQSKARLAEAAAIKKDLMAKAARRRQQVIPDPFYEKEEYEAAIDAATLLQQLLRRRHERHWMSINKERLKAERSFEANSRDQLKAALIMQKHARGYTARKTEEWQKHSAGRQQLKAALILQRYVRGYQTRNNRDGWSAGFPSVEEQERILLERKKKEIASKQGALSLITDVKKLGTASPRRTSKDVHTAAKVKQQAARNPENIALHTFDPEYLYSLTEGDKADFIKCLNSGIETPDSTKGCGCYARQPDDYDRFRPFFTKVLAKCHHVSEYAVHEQGWGLEGIKGVPADGLLDLAAFGLRANTPLNISASRNIKAFPLTAAMTKKERVDLENLMTKVFERLMESPDGEFAGRYYSLTPGHPDCVDEAQYKALLLAGLAFEDMSSEPSLAAAGIAAHWPHGRGVYITEDKDCVIWVGEEDHLCIKCMERGTVINDVFDRLKSVLDAVSSLVMSQQITDDDDAARGDGDAVLEFAYTPDHGVVTSCPTKLGTAMQASVQLKLPNLTADGTGAYAQSIAKPLGLVVRSLDEDELEWGPSVRIVPAATFCVKEAEIVANLYAGIAELVAAEQLGPPSEEALEKAAEQALAEREAEAVRRTLLDQSMASESEMIASVDNVKSKSFVGLGEDPRLLMSAAEMEEHNARMHKAAEAAAREAELIKANQAAAKEGQRTRVKLRLEHNEAIRRERARREKCEKAKRLYDEEQRRQEKLRQEELEREVVEAPKREAKLGLLRGAVLVQRWLRGYVVRQIQKRNLGMDESRGFRFDATGQEMDPGCAHLLAWWLRQDSGSTVNRLDFDDCKLSGSEAADGDGDGDGAAGTGGAGAAGGSDGKARLDKDVSGFKAMCKAVGEHRKISSLVLSSCDLGPTALEAVADALTYPNMPALSLQGFARLIPGRRGHDQENISELIGKSIKLKALSMDGRDQNAQSWVGLMADGKKLRQDMLEAKAIELQLHAATDHTGVENCYKIAALDKTSGQKKWLVGADMAALTLSGKSKREGSHFAFEEETGGFRLKLTEDDISYPYVKQYGRALTATESAPELVNQFAVYVRARPTLSLASNPILGQKYVYAAGTGTDPETAADQQHYVKLQEPHKPEGWVKLCKALEFDPKDNANHAKRRYLAVLDVSGVGMNHVGLGVLAPALPSIVETVTLDGNALFGDMTEEGAVKNADKYTKEEGCGKFFSSLAKCNKLEHLSLVGTGMGPLALQRMRAVLPKCKGLCTLDVSGNKLDEESLSRLRSAAEQIGCNVIGEAEKGGDGEDDAEGHNHSDEE